MFSHTIIVRHRRENKKKCSLKGLETRADVTFYSYPDPKLPILTNYIHLDLNGPPLSVADKDKGLLLLDATWQLEKKMRSIVPANVEGRSIPPGFVTAYPRRQTLCDDPDAGLASIEALYIAYCLMGRDPQGLLNNYHWKEAFLSHNSERLERITQK